MSVGINPLIPQGNLNRVLTHVVVAGTPNLSVTASYMTKSMASLAFDSDFNDQISTATGVVNSPQPFVIGTLTINLIRTQSLASAWITQAQTQATLGAITVYPDAPTFAPINLINCSIMTVDPGAFDGQDPTVKVTIKGVYYTNAFMWAQAQGS